MRGRRREHGSGSVLVVTVAMAALAVSLAFVALGEAAALRQRVIAAADAAALAAADTALGAAPGFPCENAARVASAHDVELVRCELDGVVATVETAAGFAGVPVHARARAGPPPHWGVSG